MQRISERIFHVDIQFPVLTRRRITKNFKFSLYLFRVQIFSKFSFVDRSIMSRPLFTRREIVAPFRRSWTIFNEPEIGSTRIRRRWARTIQSIVREVEDRSGSIFLPVFAPDNGTRQEIGSTCLVTQFRGSFCFCTKSRLSLFHGVRLSILLLFFPPFEPQNGRIVAVVQSRRLTITMRSVDRRIYRNTVSFSIRGENIILPHPRGKWLFIRSFHLTPRF